VVTIVKRHHQLFNSVIRPVPYASLALVGVIGVKSFSLSALRIIVEKVIVLDHHAGATALHSVLLLNVTKN
jgi:hypothetical protein